MTEDEAAGWARGVRAMALSAFYFSVMGLLVKVAGRRLPSQEIVLARGVITLILSGWMVRRAGIPMWGERRWLLVLRGVTGFLALSCFYHSITQLSLADATVIQHSSPIFTALIAAAVLGERLDLKVLASIGLGLAGVTLVTRPPFLFGASMADSSRAISAEAAVIALVGAITAAAAYVSVRALTRTENSLVIVFYFPLVSVPASIPPLIPVAVWPAGVDWLILLAVGVSTQLAQVEMTRGLALLPASRAIPIGYLQVVFAILWGALLFREFPDVWTLAGSLLILVGTLGLSRRAPARPSTPTRVPSSIL